MLHHLALGQPARMMGPRSRFVLDLSKHNSAPGLHSAGQPGTRKRCLHRMRKSTAPPQTGMLCLCGAFVTQSSHYPPPALTALSRGGNDWAPGLFPLFPEDGTRNLLNAHRLPKYTWSTEELTAGGYHHAGHIRFARRY